MDMAHNKNIEISFICLALVAICACDQPRNNALRRKPVEPKTPRYETIIEPSARTFPEMNHQNENDDTIENIDEHQLGSRFNPQAAKSPDAKLWPPGYEDGGVGQIPPLPPDDDEFLKHPLPLIGPGLPAGLGVGRCGDSIVQLGEECDDGNLVNTDGCNNICLRPQCGNGLIELGENCDDNNLLNGDGCDDCCEFERCGNGRLDFITKDLKEECDDGNKIPGDGCSPCCKFEICGNHVIDPGEQCDDGNKNNGDGCDDCCRLEPECVQQNLNSCVMMSSPGNSNKLQGKNEI
jgi:cysteine-rich repeat protein